MKPTRHILIDSTRGTGYPSRPEGNRLGYVGMSTDHIEGAIALTLRLTANLHSVEAHH
jgi:hypothetical protein